MDWENVGLKCGVEIHQQLLTKEKLFCKCSAAFCEKKPIKTVVRKLRPVAGEFGDIDPAALYEFVKNKTFHYKVYKNESCLVELDEEPPHPINKEALEIALKIALSLNCTIPDEIEVMRKTVIDGSNTSGFQRTCIVGMDGYIKTSFGKVGITNVCLEEESCQILEKKDNIVVYGLNRLGIPLVEIGTSIIKTPEQAMETAERIGLLLRCTGRVKRGLGTIRQDLNVSVKGGARVEIKGVQKLNLIPLLIKNEAMRQLEMIKKNKKVLPEVRKALENGSSVFLRPLPGSARLYPETDILPIEVDKAWLDDLRKHLTEDVEHIFERLGCLGIKEDVAKQLIVSDKLPWFDKLIKKGIEPNAIIHVLLSLLTQLKREGINTENISYKKIEHTLLMLKKGEITKESLRDILIYASKNPDLDIEIVVKQLDIKTMSVDRAKAIINEIVKKNKHVLKMNRPENVLMGIVMKELRGKVPGKLVMDIIKEIIEREKGKT